MYRFFEGTKWVSLFVRADGAENNTMALINCVINVLFLTGRVEQATEFEERVLASIKSGADRQGVEKVIREYVKLYILERKNPQYAAMFDGMDAFYTN